MMSSVNTLCLFSAALCNVAVIDQGLFESQSQTHQPVTNGGGGLVNQGLGLLGLNQGLNLGGATNNRPAHKPQSPCGKKFQYVTDGREWKGIIKVKNVDVNHDLQLEVDFTLPQGLQKRVSPNNQYEQRQELSSCFFELRIIKEKSASLTSKKLSMKIYRMVCLCFLKLLLRHKIPFPS